MTTVRAEARIAEAALLLMAGEAAWLARAGAAPGAMADLVAGAALVSALRSALRDGRPATRMLFLSAALASHLIGVRARFGGRKVRGFAP